MTVRMRAQGLTVMAVFLLAACSGGDARSEADDITSTEVDAPAGLSATDSKIGETVIESIRMLPDTSRFLTALEASGVTDTLKGDGPFTVFVPTDSAFDMLEEGAYAAMLLPENRAKLSEIIKVHIVGGVVKSSDLNALLDAGGGETRLKALNGSDLTARADDDMITIIDAKGTVATIGASDIAAGNGTVFLIDKLLWREVGSR